MRGCAAVLDVLSLLGPLPHRSHSGALLRRKMSSRSHSASGASTHHWPLFAEGIFCWPPPISVPASQPWGCCRNDISPTSFINQFPDWLSWTMKQRGTVQSPCLQLQIPWGCSRLWAHISVLCPVLAALSPSGGVWELGRLEWKALLFCWLLTFHWRPRWPWIWVWCCVSQCPAHLGNGRGSEFLEQRCYRWGSWACVHAMHCTSLPSICCSWGYSVWEKRETLKCIWTKPFLLGHICKLSRSDQRRNCVGFQLLISYTLCTLQICASVKQCCFSSGAAWERAVTLFSSTI